MNPLEACPFHSSSRIPIEGDASSLEPSSSSCCLPGGRLVEAMKRASKRAMASLQEAVSKEHPLQSILVRRQEEKGEELTLQEVTEQVRLFNAGCSYLSLMAGKVAFTFTCRIPAEILGAQKVQVQIRHDARGHLEVVHGPVGPISVLCDQTLSQSQVEAIQALYAQIYRDLSYNNLGELLEFLHFVKQQRTLDPQLSLSELYQRYQPDLLFLLDKYRGGTCLLLANKFCAELRKRGIEAQIWSSCPINTWTTLPMPGVHGGDRPLIVWRNFMQKIYTAGHASVFLPFLSEETKRERVLFFHCAFDEKNRCDFEVYKESEDVSGLEMFLGSQGLHSVGSRSLQIFDASWLAKARLLGRHKAVIMGRNDHGFGVDFLKGNIYLNSTWDSYLLPCNQTGEVSIQLEDLAHGMEKQDYTLCERLHESAQVVALTPRETLHQILNAIRVYVTVPDTMEEDLVTLATYADELRRDFFLPPIFLMHQLYPSIASANRTIRELIRQYGGAPPFRLEASYEQLNHCYQGINEALLRNDRVALEKALCLFKRAETLMNQRLRSPPSREANDSPVFQKEDAFHEKHPQEAGAAQSDNKTGEV